MALPLPCCVALVMLSCVKDVKSLFHGEGRAWPVPCPSPWHLSPPTAAWTLAPTHIAASGMCLYGTSLGCTDTLWVHILCLKGLFLGMSVINPSEHVFSQNEHVSKSMVRVDGASASTAWSVLGFANVN